VAAFLARRFGHGFLGCGPGGAAGVWEADFVSPGAADDARGKLDGQVPPLPGWLYPLVVSLAPAPDGPGGRGEGGYRQPERGEKRLHSDVAPPRDPLARDPRARARGGQGPVRRENRWEQDGQAAWSAGRGAPPPPAQRDPRGGPAPPEGLSPELQAVLQSAVGEAPLRPRDAPPPAPPPRSGPLPEYNHTALGGPLPPPRMQDGNRHVGSLPGAPGPGSNMPRAVPANSHVPQMQGGAGPGNAMPGHMLGGPGPAAGGPRMQSAPGPGSAAPHMPGAPGPGDPMPHTQGGPHMQSVPRLDNAMLLVPGASGAGNAVAPMQGGPGPTSLANPPMQGNSSVSGLLGDPNPGVPQGMPLPGPPSSLDGMGHALPLPMGGPPLNTGAPAGMGGGLPPPTGESATIFVEGIPADCKDREAAHIFRAFEGFKGMRLCMRKNSVNVTLCFAEYETPGHARAALERLNGYVFDPKGDPSALPLKVQMSHSKTVHLGSRPRGRRGGAPVQEKRFGKDYRPRAPRGR